MWLFADPTATQPALADNKVTEVEAQKVDQAAGGKGGEGVVQAEVHMQDEVDAANNDKDYPLDDDDLEYPEDDNDSKEEQSQEELQDPDFKIEEYGGQVVGTARIQVHIVSRG